MLSDLLFRLRALFSHKTVDEELDEELRAHFEQEAEKFVKRGLSQDEAARQARLAFGGLDQVKEECRKARGVSWIETTIADVGYGLRVLRKNKSFTAVTVLTLALGIGASTAIFSLVNAVLLRPLPYGDPEHLVFVGTDAKDADRAIAYKHYEGWRQSSKSLEDIAIFYRNSGWSRVTLAVDEPEFAQGTFASANFFSVMGIAPAIGRAFTADEAARRERLLVLSDGLWKRKFGGSTGALGKTLLVNGQSFQIIGVMPASFQFPGRDVQFWAPITTNTNWTDQPAQDGIHSLGYFWRWHAVGRLKAGVPAETAQAELNAIGAQWRGDPGLEFKSANVVPLQVEVATSVRLALYMLLGSVLCVLLITCSNAANLMLARGATRYREMAIRTALGARRGRLVRQLITESMVLTFIAGCLGLAVASYGAQILISLAPGNIPRLEQTGTDVRVLGFALGISLLSAVVFGLIPAIKTSRGNPGDALRYGAPTAARKSRTRALLVVSEFALSLLLLTGAGLLMRSLMAVEAVDPGFRTENVVTMTLLLTHGAEASQQSTFYGEVLERLGALPGVQFAGGISGLFETEVDNHGLRIVEGRAPEPHERWTPLTWATVSGSYFQAMGAQLLKGRFFSDADGPDSQVVAIIDESLARRYWPNEDPIGKHFKGGDKRGKNDDWITVIGMVPDMRRSGLENNPTGHVYVWYKQDNYQFLTPDIVVRGNIAPDLLAKSLRGAVRTVNRNVVVSSMATMTDQLDLQLAPRRFQTGLLGLFAAIAVLLATIGIYGVMHYEVAQRTREIGIRMALGAQRKQVLWMVQRQALVVCLAGVIAGILPAVMGAHLLRSMLFGVVPGDPFSFAAAVCGLVLVALAASAIPARRAASVDPLAALRYE
jgi:predicted permease